MQLETDVIRKHYEAQVNRWRCLTGRNLAMVQKTILVVDDDPDVRLGLQLRLNANHYDVICAADGVASIAEARKHMPDLVILDLGLPAGDGFSVLARLKANEKLSSIPVIVLSGRDRGGNRDRALKAGAKTFLQKPMANDKLLSVIRLVLEAENHTPQVVYDLAARSVVKLDRAVVQLDPGQIVASSLRPNDPRS
jgi:DNA-binding response OmpR family regulator